MRTVVLALAIAAPLVGGCAVAPVTDRATAQPISITHSSYGAADQLVSRSQAPVAPDKPVMVTTFVNNGNLQQASPFGRLVSEQISSRLANAGFTVHELKLANALTIREGTGEIILSRDARDLSRTAGAQAVVVGTYTAALSRVYVNAKLVRSEDGRVLSAVDFDLPRTDDISYLLGWETVDVGPLR